MIANIEKFDNHGRGITYINDKIVFVPNALPEEKVEIEITKETTKFDEAKVVKLIEKSSKRVKSKCPFYPECGGCQLRHMSYDDTLSFKKDKVQNILKKYASLEPEIEVIKNPNRDFYRNKIEIKIEQGIAGFYKSGTHEIVEIDRCLNAEEAINSFLLNLDMLGLNNADVTIKSNNNGEILVSIHTEEEPKIDIDHLREKNKLVGIIVNDKVMYGTDHFIDIVEDKFFKESYNSFFQINRNVNSELFKILRDNMENSKIVLDLCSGVGTLSIVASEKAEKVYGIEIVENAVKDALLNARMNRRDNVNFMLGDAFSSIDKIKDKIDTIIADPPRTGLNRLALESILKHSPSNMIYISCDQITLARDLKVLSTVYETKKVYILDMFSYTYHVETVCILERKKIKN